MTGKRRATPKAAPKSRAAAPSEGQVVETMAAHRIPHMEIAACLGISEPTLRRRFRKEIATGTARLEQRLTEALERQAMGAPAEFNAKGKLIRAEQRPYAPAAMYLLNRLNSDRTKAAMRKAAAEALASAERIRLAELKVASEAEANRPALDLSDASPAELEVLERFFRRKVANAA